MDINKVNSILSNDDKVDVFYQDRPVWIQSVSKNKLTAKVGFVDNFEERDVYIKDLYKKNYPRWGYFFRFTILILQLVLLFQVFYSIIYHKDASCSNMPYNFRC